MFKYFFLSKENLPDNVGFSLYDNQHLTWLFLITLFIIVLSKKYKEMSSYKKNITKKILGSSILLTEVFYQSILIFTGQFNVNYLPLHLCSLSVFLCFYDSFRPNNLVKEFIYCLGMPGALAALLFPNWTMCPLFNFIHINSFVSHGLIVAYPIILLRANELNPNYKRLPSCLLYLLIASTPIYFLNKILNTNFFFLNSPSEGSPLVSLENWLGNPGYIVGMLFMVLICWIVLYIPVFAKTLHIKKRNLLKA